MPALPGWCFGCFMDKSVMSSRNPPSLCFSQSQNISHVVPKSNLRLFLTWCSAAPVFSQVHICLLNTLRVLLMLCSAPLHSSEIPKGFFINVVLGALVCSCVYCLLLNKWLSSAVPSVLCVLVTHFFSVSSLIWAEDSCLCDSTVHRVRELTQLPITTKLKKRTPVLSWLLSALLSCLVCWTAIQMLPWSQILRQQCGRRKKLCMERRLSSVYATACPEMLVKVTLQRTSIDNVVLFSYMY